MKFRISWLALLSADQEFVTVGFLAMDADGDLFLATVPGAEPTTAELLAVIEGAPTDGDLWEYLLERGIGSHSSFSDPVEVDADGFAALAAALLPQAAEVQAGGERSARPAALDSKPGSR